MPERAVLVAYGPRQGPPTRGPVSPCHASAHAPGRSAGDPPRPHPLGGGAVPRSNPGSVRSIDAATRHRQAREPPLREPLDETARAIPVTPQGLHRGGRPTKVDGALRILGVGVGDRRPRGELVRQRPDYRVRLVDEGVSAWGRAACPRTAAGQGSWAAATGTMATAAAVMTRASPRRIGGGRRASQPLEFPRPGSGESRKSGQESTNHAGGTD